MDLDKMLYYETVGNLINKKGLLHFDMNDVANSLSISIDKLVKIFKNKESLLVHYVEHDIADYEEKISTIADLKVHPVQEIMDISACLGLLFFKVDLSYFADLKVEYPAVFALYRDFTYDFGYELLKNNIKRGVESGEYRKNIKAEIITLITLNQIIGYFDYRYSNRKLNASEVFMEGTFYFLYGVTSNEGRIHLEKNYI